MSEKLKTITTRDCLSIKTIPNDSMNVSRISKRSHREICNKDWYLCFVLALGIPGKEVMSLL